MRRMIMIPMLMTPLLLAACGTDEAPAERKESGTEAKVDNWEAVKGGETVSHIHGSGFWQEDERPVIATHAGLMEYREDGWYALTENRHDYMGFELVEDGFYASGHPDRRTDYKNPLGVIHGKGHGESLEVRSLEGEADFHYMSAGYASDSIYVYLGEATNELKPGFYRSFDGGSSFEPMALDGVDGNKVAGIVADATESKRVFLYGPSGILVSTNGGDTFEPLIEGEKIVTVGSEDGRLAYIHQDGMSLEGVVYDLEDDSTTTFELPEMEGEVVPIDLSIKGDRLLLVTSDNSVYEYEQNEWQTLLQAGEID